MKVKFIYTKCNPNHEIEKVIVNLYKHLCENLSLPNNITVQFIPMHDSQYAETVIGNKYLIKINSNFNYKEIFKPFVHEVIHLHQIYTGVLSVDQKGDIIWAGTKYTNDPNSNYHKLPWELDVNQKLPKILESILRLY